MTLENIFKKYKINLFQNEQLRDPIDILEDLYLKLNTDEYVSLMKEISSTESLEGHIFDEARNKPYT
jgi:hypothetical protein